MVTRCGAIAIVGRPNVGKSTLLNRLVGSKISITSTKPQTTRHLVRGIRTEGETQYVFVDTPGYQTRHGGALNQSLNRSMRRSLADVDVVLQIVAAGELTNEDRTVAKDLGDASAMVIGVNKLDRLENPNEVLPFMGKLAEAFPGRALVPISARTGKNLPELLAVVAKLLPEQPFLYDADDITDRDERFLAAELIREKLFRVLHEEIPYGAFVAVDSFKMDGKLRRIAATIYVDKLNHKSMVIGAKGEQLKAIGSAARRDMEALFGGKVFLELWVKPRPGWPENPVELKRFGFE